MWKRSLKSLMLSFAVVFIATVTRTTPTLADSGDRDSILVGPATTQAVFSTQSHFGSSPFEPPESNDNTFVVDQAPWPRHRLLIPQPRPTCLRYRS